MNLEGKPQSMTTLGQMRKPSEGDIKRSIEAAARTPTEKRDYAQRMARLDHIARRFMATQQGKQQQQTVAPKATDKAEPRHNPDAKASYGRQALKGLFQRGRVPEHMAIQRTIQAHIQRNVQRAARRERVRQVGRQVKATAAAAVRQLRRAARGQAQSVPLPPGRSQAAQSELAAKGKMQSMNRHREQTLDKGKEAVKDKGREKAASIQRTPVRQPQQQRGKEQDRGRSR